MKFRKRTDEEISALEFIVEFDRDPSNRLLFFRLSSDERLRLWREMPGGEAPCHQFDGGLLRYEPVEVEADDWRHLCSIVGLKEFYARVFYQGVFETPDFETENK